MKDDENKIKDLSSAEAIEKIKELAEKENICMFVTMLSQIPLDVRPMATQKVEDDGSLWFFSSKIQQQEPAH